MRQSESKHRFAFLAFRKAGKVGSLSLVERGMEGQGTLESLQSGAFQLSMKSLRSQI